MNTTLDCVINSNTYMNSITIMSLPICIKHLHQPLDLEQHYHVHMSSTPISNSHGVRAPSAAATNPLNNDIICLNDPTKIPEANHD